MAKKLRFTGMDVEIMETINRILEVRFVRIEACADIRRQLKKLEVEIEDLSKQAGELPETDEKGRGEIQEKITEKYSQTLILEERRKLIMKYSGSFLKDTKSGKVRVPGAYSKVLDLDGTSMYSYYVDAVDRESINDTKECIGYKTAVTELMDKWGLGEAPKTLKAKFASIVCMKSLGVETASGAKIVKGELLKYKSASKYQETMVDIMVDYMNRKGGVDIIVPDKADYEYRVVYGESNGAITIEEFGMVSK